MCLKWWLTAAAVLLPFSLAVAYFAVYPLASACLGLSMLINVLGFWWVDYESRRIAIGEPISAHRLPDGIYFIYKYIIFPSRDIGALVYIDGLVKYCRLFRYETHPKHPITCQEIEDGYLDYFEVVSCCYKEGGGTRLFLMRFHR